MLYQRVSDVHLSLILQVKEHEQEAAKLEAVFPCILRILPTCVFNKKDPIVVGADIVEGIAKVCKCLLAMVTWTWHCVLDLDNF